MPKSPSFQFYPGDWLRNDVSGCSLEAQGLWLRMMMVMHDAQEYGQLVLNNEPMPPEFVAKKVGISVKKYSNLLRELEFAGVINRHENGVIYSGRMERDERERQQNRARQRKHYEETHPEPNGGPNGDITEGLTVNLTPPLHSSSSSSDLKEREDTPQMERIEPLFENPLVVLYEEKFGVKISTAFAKEIHAKVKDAGLWDRLISEKISFASGTVAERQRIAKWFLAAYLERAEKKPPKQLVTLPSADTHYADAAENNKHIIPAPKVPVVEVPQQ